MSVVRGLVLVYLATTGCGKVVPGAMGDAGLLGDGGAGDSPIPGDASPDLDSHLQAATGWNIELFVDLTAAGFAYNRSDFVDNGTVSNQPRYVAALYPPFSSSLAVLAGRTVIEVAPDHSAHLHSFSPAGGADKGGPDMLGRATFANLGQAQSGLWVTSSSQGSGDGLYLIDDQWAISRMSSENNTYALALDPTGAYDSVGSAALYVSVGVTVVERWTAALASVFAAPAGVEEFAIANGALFMTTEATDTAPVELDRVGPGTSHTITALKTSQDLVLAEGSTTKDLYAIQDDAQLVTVSQTDGALTRDAWTSDPDWTWISVSAPRGDHATLAGKLIVLESNRTLNRDRLLLITPP